MYLYREIFMTVLARIDHRYLKVGFERDFFSGSGKIYRRNIVLEMLRDILLSINI